MQGAKKPDRHQVLRQTEWDGLSSREKKKLDHIRSHNATGLHLGLNFENKLSEVCNFEPKYLTPEQEPISKIISSPDLLSLASSEHPVGALAAAGGGAGAGVVVLPVMISASGLCFFGVSLLNFPFILYMRSVCDAFYFYFQKRHQNRSKNGTSWLCLSVKARAEEKKSSSLTFDSFGKYIYYWIFLSCSF